MDSCVAFGLVGELWLVLEDGELKNSIRARGRDGLVSHSVLYTRDIGQFSAISPFTIKPLQFYCTICSRNLLLTAISLNLRELYLAVGLYICLVSGNVVVPLQPRSRGGMSVCVCGCVCN